MIDIHLHILPGVDDGPDSLEETIALARMLVAEGVTAAIATPHYNDEYPQLPARDIRERVTGAQRALDGLRIPLRLYAGHEALISPTLLADIQAGKIATLNGSRYLLLELWNDSWAPMTEQIIFALLANDIIPVIAHPERNRVLRAEPGRLETLIQHGALAQVTAGSLVGRWGKTIQQATIGFLKRNMVHLIASDAHGPQKRQPWLAQALQVAAATVGMRRALQMVETNPTLIVSNADIPAFAPARKEARR